MQEQPFAPTNYSNVPPAKNLDLPHDLLAEKAFLGCLLIDNRAFDDVVDLGIRPEDFYHPQYSTIFSAIYGLATDSRPFDMVSTCAQLQDMGKLEVIGGQTGISDLIEDTVTSANIYHYAKIIKNKSTLREIVRTSMRISETGKNFVGDVEEFIDEVESSFFNLASESRSNTMIPLKESLKNNSIFYNEHNELAFLRTSHIY